MRASGRGSPTVTVRPPGAVIPSAVSSAAGLPTASITTSALRSPT